MIPTRLFLERFLCYRDPVEVDFSGLHLACLSGENGAGKSALLDAMTWALWEQARAGNQHLVSLGESDTRVEFSFLLDGREYRVTRGYTASGRTRSLLELHVRTEEGWVPVATGNKHAVQREIDRLLGISYTTFVNSVFLLQGKADEFTRRTPSERKRILAELLELDRYERYRELAREEGRRLREERLRLEHEREILAARTAEIPSLRERLTTLERIASVQYDELRRLRDHVTAWQERVHRLTIEIDRYRERQRRAQTLRSQREQILAELERLAADERQHAALLAREAEIRERAAERQRLQQELQEVIRISSVRQQLTERIGRLAAERATREQHLLLEIRAREEQLARYANELAHRAERELEQRRLRAELVRLEELRTERDGIETQLQTLRERTADLQAILQAYAAYEARQREILAELRSLDSQRQQLAKDVAQRGRLEQERQQLQTDLARLSTVRVEREAIERELASLRTQDAELTALGKQLRAQMAELNEQLQQLERLDAICPVCLRPLSPEERARQIAERQTKLTALREEFEARHQEVRAIREHSAALDRKLKEIAQRLQEEGALQARLGRIDAELDRLGQVTQQLEVLEQQIRQLRQAERSDAQLLALERDILTLEHRLGEFMARPIGTLAERCAAYRQAALEVQEQIASLQQRRDELNERLSGESTLQAQLGRIAAELERFAQLERERVRVEQELQQLRDAYSTDPQLAALEQQIRELKEQLAALPYDEAHHRQLEQRVAALAAVDEEMRALDQARVALRFVRQQIEQSEQRYQAVVDELTALEQELSGTKPPEEELAAATRDLEEAGAALADAETALHATQAEIGAVGQQLRDAERAAEEAAALAARLDHLAREQAVLEELEHAFGKHGIQTLILENVLPELAETANDILDRLPGNTLRLDFATQRERVSGDGAIETLDILISDEFGQRPYELYSGGEAFRINFALRVALSLLLAQRAGRRLETLVIDEGFGTQDTKGREGLVQALQAVRDRFALILVVTHLEELKDQFPQRIEVTKTPSGSQVTVVV
ncbi:SMC family ATPase [Thermomicrobium sp. 4228-Ro]|uniref:AAA family ATPase n=1 Tax=Thermomicrobium sp. 4228-Ro TaxID=2993937 RepID=UPI002248B7ED|nr:SMC family ATPase [Thermomicrobium sp. 4228-Ro]MCX2727467.1 SMC family ATPase [Thermomicrobium sp. 4228-Ro]